MSEALQLFDVPEEPKLTPRQAHARDAIVAAGYDGLHTDELGATVHAFAGKHDAESVCQWCGQAGLEVGRALRAKGLVQQRRRKTHGDTVLVWTVTGDLKPPRAATTTDIWPEGF